MKPRARNINPWSVSTFLLIAVTVLVSPQTPSAQTAVKTAPKPSETLVNPQSAPSIIETSPRVGETDVDPNLTEITVTFDRDMEPGFSWTGGGPEYPSGIEGKKVEWRNKRTCVLPVKLAAGHFYRVGINSPSHQNFRSATGVSAAPTAIYFATVGASQALRIKAMKPQIVSINPKSGSTDVDPTLKELRVTFSVPMSAGFSWTGGGPEYPTIPEGKKPFWTEDHKTCVLPVELNPGTQYRLGLNSPSHRGFQGTNSVALDPVVYTFKTK